MAIKGKPPAREAVQRDGQVTRAWLTWFESIEVTVNDTTYLATNVTGEVNEIDVTDNGDGSITIGIEDVYPKNHVLSVSDEIDVIDNADGTVSISITDTFLTAHVAGASGQISITDAGSGTIKIGVSNSLFPAYVLGATNEIDVTDNGDGTITLSVDASLFSTYVAGTTNNIDVIDDGDGTITLSLSDTISLNQDIVLTDTTNASKYGIIYKDTDTFIHNFNYGDNGTVTTVGYNTFIGVGAGNLTMGATATAWFHASYNVGIGYGALRANNNGMYNLAIGSIALYKNTDGVGNTGIGSNALANNTTGGANVGIGYNALYSNVVGGNNVGIGHSSLKSNTGSNNVGIGQGSLYYNTSGSNNVAVGQGCLYYNTAPGNTASGKNAGYSFTTGGYNSCYGYYAGRYTSALTANQTSTYCCYFGGNTKASADGVTYETVLGYGAEGNGSHTVTLGASSNTDVFASGNLKAIGGGVVPNEGGAGTRPAAGADVRGMIWVTQNGAGVADTVEICLKSSADTYSWVVIATG